MRRTLPTLFALVLILCTAACAGRTFLARPDAVRSVRSIAVVGFDTYVSADIGARISSLMGPDLLIQTLSNGWRPNAASPIDSREAYAAFCERISRELGVKVLSFADVSENAAYIELTKNRAMGHSVGNLRVDGILSGESVRSLTQDERRALMAALGVDALMSIEVSYWVDNSDTVSEIGGERLWGRIDAALYGEGEEPIWRDQADGERSKNGLPPLVNQEALGAIRVAVEEATENALRLLFAHLADRCPDCRNASLPNAGEVTQAPADAAGQAEEAAPSAPAPAPSESTESTAAAADPQEGAGEAQGTEAAGEAESAPSAPAPAADAP